MDPCAAAARDLKWAIESPSLVQEGSLDAFSRRIGASPFEPSAELLQALAERRTLPLGRYFERLVEAWLRGQEGVTGLHSNLVLRDGSRTLGEIDLLFEAHSRVFHWELAVKLYLGVGDRTRVENWHGPLGRDRLDRKLSKLVTQLALLDTESGRALRTELGIGQVESQSIIKGYLFHPFAKWQEGNRRHPPEIHPEHAHGFWIHRSDVEAILSRSRHWAYLEKLNWLAPARGIPIIASDALVGWLDRYFESETRPPLLVAVNEEGDERERGFVVADDYGPSPRARSA